MKPQQPVLAKAGELGANSRPSEKNDGEDKKTLTDETKCPPEASSYKKWLFLLGVRA